MNQQTTAAEGSGVNPEAPTKVKFRVQNACRTMLFLFLHNIQSDNTWTGNAKRSTVFPPEPKCLLLNKFHKTPTKPRSHNRTKPFNFLWADVADTNCLSSLLLGITTVNPLFPPVGQHQSWWQSLLCRSTTVFFQNSQFGFGFRSDGFPNTNFYISPGWHLKVLDCAPLV